MRSTSNILSHAERLLEERRLPEAVSLFHCAEAANCDPDRCAAGRWMASMLAGDFEAGWRECDSIRQRAMPDPNRFWQGEDLTGKRIIIRCLHGFGDAVQLLRYVSLVKAVATYVIVECAPPMVELVHCIHGIDEVITWGPGAPVSTPVWDVQLELMELPYIFRSTLASLPPITDYLQVPAAQHSYGQRVLGTDSRIRVGVVWTSGEWNPTRSLPLDSLLSVLDRSECQFWNLQGGATRKQWQGLVRPANLRDHPALDHGGVLRLAGIAAQLDLIISVDTLAAHLAGSLHIPCFLMLPYAADWRWMVDREDSPWYPSLRLFRQPKPGDWAGVVRQIDRLLDEWLRRNTKGRFAA